MYYNCRATWQSNDPLVREDARSRRDFTAETIHTVNETVLSPLPAAETLYKLANDREVTATNIGWEVAGVLPIGKIGKGTGVLLKGTRVFRYMTEGEIKAIQKTGILRGCNISETYFTKDIFNSVSKEQRRLGLPSIPTYRVDFEVLSDTKLIRNGTKVTPLYGQPGKGAEFMTTDPVHSKIINYQKLNK